MTFNFNLQTLTFARVDVWCPPGYAEQPERRYPVIYMPDGQNLFTGEHAIGGVAWEVDRAVERLMDAGVTDGAIIVGVWNGPQRWRDYMPQVALPPDAEAQFLATAGGPSHSDRYVDFLVQELKPLVDATYRTLPDAAHTTLMGSSMGGLISLYTLEQYPAVFGAAACLSTHWTAGGPALVDALAARLPPPGQHRLYFDHGTAGLDAAYAPNQQRMDAAVAAAGYRRDVDWVSRVFAGAEHNESAWRARVELPLRFLLRASA